MHLNCCASACLRTKNIDHTGPVGELGRMALDVLFQARPGLATGRQPGPPSRIEVGDLPAGVQQNNALGHAFEQGSVNQQIHKPSLTSVLF